MKLSAEQRSHWSKRGWLVLPGALGRSVRVSLDRWVDDVEEWSHGGELGLHHYEQTDHGPKLARSEDFDPHHRELSSFMRSGLIVEVLAQLFGEEPRLFKEKINYKYPGGAGFAPHQDASAYRFVDHHISVMVPLDPQTTESGCLYFSPVVPGSLLPNRAGRIDPDWVAHARWVPLECRAGDLVFFDSYTPHYSGTNHSQQARRAIYLTYNRATAGDHRTTYYADKRALLDSVQAGATVRLSVNDDFLGRSVPQSLGRG